MSGWRSGAGRRGNLLDDAIADPASMLGRTPAQRAGNRMFLVLMAVAIAIIAADGWYEASLRPPHRALPAPINSTVVIVPVGQLADGLLDGLAGDYRDAYGLTLMIAKPFTLDPSLRGTDGRPIAAEAITIALLLDDRSPSLVVGVTADPITTTGSDADGDMAQRIAGRAAVISTFPLVSMKTISRSTLFRKMLTRQLGFLAWRLPPTDDPYDLLYRSVLNEVDVQRVSDHL